jgi:hypothetical protein
MKHYSRRELYALGEPLGESVTQAKVGGGRIYGGGGSGGGGGGQPQQNTTVNTNIPEYAKPYVETMLGAAQKQAYKYDDAGNVVGFQPYVPYGATVGPGGQITNTAQEQAQAAIAPFSPMQERAFQQTANLQVPGQFALGTGYQALGGIGALNAGQQYNQMAINPYAQQAFMSPYMQNVVDVQKNEALRDAQMRNIGANLGAARQGTYGGARQLLAEQERNRNLQTQLGQIQSAGSQEAFKSAQQAQQFGANLGLQGYQQAVGAGKALVDTGGAQLQAQQGIIGLQSQAGAQQQALEQQRINQAIQNYALQQQNPQLQLSLMSSLTRGLPLQQSTTQQYQAAPSALSQIGGLGAAGVGLYGMGRSAGIFGKEGGHVKKLASGGITGMSKKVLLNPEDFSTNQVKTMTDKGMISRLVGAPILDAKMKDEQRMKFAQAAQQPKPIDTIAADIMARAAASQGIDNAESNLPVMSAFDGGIVAMADGGEVDDGGVVRLRTGGDGSPDTRSEFEYDIDRLKKFFGERVPAIGTALNPFAGAGKYFTQPRMTAVDREEQEAGRIARTNPITGPVYNDPKLEGPKILPDEPRASAAAPAASAPSVADTGGRGINDILKRFEETLGKGAERDTEAKKMAFWSSLAQLGFGAMGGTSRSGLTNIGQAGAPAVASGMQQLRDIEGRQEKRGLAQLQAALEGEKLKAEYTKLDMMQPYYKEYANFLARRQGSTGTAGLGSVPFGEFRKIKSQYDGYLMDGKTVRASPLAKYLTPDELNALKASPGTPSYDRGMARAAEVAKQRMDAELREGMQYTAKQRVASPVEDI